MEADSSAPIAQPLPSSGVSTRWLWVAIAALGVCMAALAGVWLLMPGEASASVAARATALGQRSANVVSGMAREAAEAASAADVAQGIQLPRLATGLGMVAGNEEHRRSVQPLQQQPKSSLPTMRLAHGG